jgi:hypothetical protein
VPLEKGIVILLITSVSCYPVDDQFYPADNQCYSVDNQCKAEVERQLSTYESRFKATWKRELKLPWREAGPPHHHDDKVDSDQ